MNDMLPINQLVGRGHNSASAPLAEVLSEELAADRARADELLVSASAARITNDAEAGKVADLIVLIREHERTVDRRRDIRKRPFLADCRIIDATFGTITGPLARARTGPGSLSEMLAAWQQEHGGAPLATSIAAVGSRREITFVIEDLPAVIDWLLENRGGEIAQAARTILGSALRSFGVNGAPHLEIPGVTVSVVNKTQVR